MVIAHRLQSYLLVQDYLVVSVFCMQLCSLLVAL